jgi:hypothetical protein
VKTNFAKELRLAAREAEILALLIHSLPVLSLSQITCHFYSGDRSNAARSLRRLLDAHLINVSQILTRTPPTPILTPLASWTPGLTKPNAYALAHRLQARWTCQGSRRRRIVNLGSGVGSILGIELPTRPSRPLQVSHDLGLAEQYLYFRSQRDSRCDWWFGEHFFPACGVAEVGRLLSDGGQRPDALVVNQSQQIDYAVEYGGLYNAKRLERFHRWCQRRSLPYEIW